LAPTSNSLDSATRSPATPRRSSPVPQPLSTRSRDFPEGRWACIRVGTPAKESCYSRGSLVFLFFLFGLTLFRCSLHASRQRQRGCARAQREESSPSRLRRSRHLICYLSHSLSCSLVPSPPLDFSQTVADVVGTLPRVAFVESIENLLVFLRRSAHRAPEDV